jgi:hypothetical protein
MPPAGITLPPPPTDDSPRSGDQVNNDIASDAPHRAPDTGTGSRPAGIGVAVVAATSAVISYSHVRHLAEHSGETPLAALLLPLALDGAIAAAVAVVLADSRHGRHTRILTWVLLALGLTGSLAANIANAEPTLTARMIAAWPPLLLAVGVEVLAGLGRNTPAQQVPLVPEQAEQHRNQPEPGTEQAVHARNQLESGAEHGRNTGAVPGPVLTGTTKQRATTQLAMSIRTGQPITGPDLAAALHISSSYARRLIREHADHCATPISGDSESRQPLLGPRSALHSQGER